MAASGGGRRGAVARHGARPPSRWHGGGTGNCQSAAGSIDAGGYGVRVYEAGSSGRCVVIVPGAGDCAASWIPVANQVASFARVISYDRAGLGGSENGPPATLDRYLTELHSVIGQAGAQGPLILAGHSLGGLITRVYTREHPGQVAGLVQVDATPEAIAGDPGVKVGFLASGMMASMFKALARLGFVRFLLALGKLPLYPEQGLFRAQVTDEDYRYWTAAVVVTSPAPPAANCARYCPPLWRLSGAGSASPRRSSVTCRSAC